MRLFLYFFLMDASLLFGIFASFPVLVIVFILLVSSIRQINQYERGVMFLLGKYTGIKMPGWRIVLPVIQSMRKVDVRTKTVDVPEQETITKDNIPIRMNAVIYYKIVDAAKSVIEVENFYYAVTQLAQVAMRNVVGQVTLDELLKKSQERLNDMFKGGSPMQKRGLALAIGGVVVALLALFFSPV